MIHETEMNSHTTRSHRDRFGINICEHYLRHNTREHYSIYTTTSVDSVSMPQHP